MPAEKHAVVFDLGGVLIDWDPRHLYRKLLDNEDEIEWFLANVCTAEWNHRQDMGRPFAEGIAELVARFPEHERLIRTYRDRWAEMLEGEIAESVAIMKRLRERGHRLFALTNWSAETFPYARERFAFLDDFEGIVVSGELGMAKPDAEIYEYLLTTWDVDPAASIFVDDREENVEAARAVGMQGHHFRSSGLLRRYLEDQAVL